MVTAKNMAVANWLFIGAVMIVVQILLGGITRLTDSGLSITEWKPILGAIPPMNEAQWNEAFDKYKTIAQFKELHNYFTLSDFKSIYFWEWLHRNWGRFMGLVFVIPFAIFIYKRKIDWSMLWPMVILFFLGALQGLLGWVMVSSGVGTSLIYVDHIKLAIHFIAALLLLVYVMWFALSLSIPRRNLPYAPSIQKFSILLLVLLTIQLIFGAFMAGTHAANAALTWPDMNGGYVPKMLIKDNFFYDISNNLLTIQFIHRNLAYLLAILIVAYTFRLSKQYKTSYLYKMRFVPLFLVIAQTALGIFTLLYYPTKHKLILGILHQLTGIFLLLSHVFTYYVSRGYKALTP